MNAKQLDAIESRLVKTVLPPWRWSKRGNDCAPFDGSFQEVGNILVLEGHEHEIVLSLDKDTLPCDDDIAEFLVHCRDDIALLLDEVRHLKVITGEAD